MRTLIPPHFDNSVHEVKILYLSYLINGQQSEIKTKYISAINLNKTSYVKNKILKHIIFGQL